MGSVTSKHHEGFALYRSEADAFNCYDACPLFRRDIVGELADAGICSLKLEGRMKAPDYVHAVVRAYRSALDETVPAPTGCID